MGLLALFVIAAMGRPVALAIIAGVVVYLGVGGQDLAIAGETIVQRLFDGFLLLAVPLFITSANIMNAGAISNRLLNFCVQLLEGSVVDWVMSMLWHHSFSLACPDLRLRMQLVLEKSSLR